MENCILADFKTEVDSSFYMNGINDLDDLDVVLNNLKQKLEKIKEAWKNRDFSAEGDDFDEALNEILKEKKQ